ncbi:hypothetical protein PaG_02995 [Moesziomyces aphidis]|uniref:RING-type domain-containing protein n=1 Tax=Moesziomyces aphidis TaxID=84754 RepID=W3VR13_MOEAP|nr:hypothetical protein PaG_02995 [Moesziomyces aphidis]
MARSSTSHRGRPSVHEPNASIWPIQLLDRGKNRFKAPSSSATTAQKRFAYVPVPLLDFEDLSFFVNFDWIAAKLGLDPSGGEPDHLRAGAKRRHASPEHDTARAKRAVKDEVTEQTSTDLADLVDTHCLFRVKARESRDIDSVLAIKEQLDRPSTHERLHVADVAFDLEEFSPGRPMGSVISRSIRLRDVDTGTLIATLPAVADDASKDANFDPHKLTNSSWITSLSHLLSKDAVTSRASLDIVSHPSDYPSERVTAGSLFLKLSIRVQAKVSIDATGRLAADLMLDMARLVRLALPPNQNAQVVEEGQEMERDVEVDAGFVYRNLRPASLNPPESVQHPDLVPTLLPFQRRSTAFVLGREGVVFDAQGNLVKSDHIYGHSGPSDLGLWWCRVDSNLFYNWIEARFVRDPTLTRLSNCRGAMLAEEMGLGKTVEAVALMLLSPDPDATSRAGWYDDRNEIDVVPTKTTLIVAPETLRTQWIEEIEQHAPGLSVYSYAGRTKAENDVPEGLTWEQWAQRFDVMIISYATLSRELSTAKSERTRSRRFERKYERPRSPLVKLHFHRVLMDEVQMIGSSNAAETVSMISRGSSVAVSGTPVKKLDDLKSCFRFLKVPGYLATPAEWQSILHPLLGPALVQVLQTIGTRHTKAQVAGEMSLPLQTRSVIPIDFTSIEAAFYADVWSDALNDTGYTTDGNPHSQDHQMDVSKMRQHLLLLRQACTHPQVALQFRGGVVGSKNLRSIDEVLELMIDSTSTELHSTRTHWFDRRIHRNILGLYRRDEDQRVLAASQFSDIEAEIHRNVTVLEREIRDASTSGPLYRFTADEIELEQKAEARRKRMDPTGADQKNDEDADPALAALMEDPEAYQALLDKRKSRAAHVTQLKALLRFLLMKLHRLLQFQGNLYFQRGEFLDEQQSATVSALPTTPPQESYTANAGQVKVEDNVDMVRDLTTPPLQSAEGDVRITETKIENVLKPTMSRERQALKDKEDAAYAKAEKVRQRLLVEAGEEVQAAIARLNRDQVELDAAAVRASTDLFEEGGGIRSSEAYGMLADNVQLLDKHAQVLFRWRGSIIDRLVRAVNRDVSLEREDDDQYQENLDTQAEAEVLLEMYRPLLSEREKILKGGVAVGATDRPRLFKELEEAVRIARQNDLRGIEPETEADEELIRVQKQQLTHFKTLDQERKSVSLYNGKQSVVSVIEQLKALRDNSLRNEETVLATRAYLEARRIVNEQVKHLDKLRNEEKLLLTALFNARSRYFKEIQVLSDTVRDPIFSDLERNIHSTQKEESDAVSKVDELERRLRYLLHLQKVQSADDLDDEAKICNICTDPIETGILTNKCGHVCCENCWKEWQSQGHRTCVLCQTRVLPTEVHRIIYSRPQASAKSGQVASTTSRSGTLANAATGFGADPLAVRYNELDDNLRGVLNRLATQGRFGSKIDHLTKHVQHIVNQTGEKSLIFSSFGRGLDVVAQALTANGIRHVRLTGAGKSGSESAKLFRSDPNIHVMLLHSEVQSSGLNLLAASHIHILEPLLNTSLELQAIGRVHRIGQTKETHVWCYYVKDTVEERILALSAYKGQSIYLAGRNTSATDGSMTLATSSSNKSAAAEQARQDAKKWSAFGKGAKSGKAGAIRGDITSNTAELLACFFARFLPALGSIPANQSSAISANSASASGSNGHTVANGEVGSGSEEVEDERTRLRRARLAALEQRQAGQSS